MDQPLLHVATLDDLERARKGGRYRAASLDAEGFLHCCDPDQLAGVLERFFAGVPDLHLLRIDPARLDAQVVRENTMGGEEPFPHVYGEVPMTAVVSVEPLPGGPGADETRLGGDTGAAS